MSDEVTQSGPGVTVTPVHQNTARNDSGDRIHPAPPPTQVGRYLLLKRLGEGGMGVVYAAYDPDLDRKVALKLLRPDGVTDSEDARARLLREAQAMARVSHPNVIPIFDVGMFGDQVFLAMELVEGGTLASWLKEGPRPWREVLERFLAAGRGLMAAHEAGLVHRDFKPANVLVNRSGRRVYVTDFGLARQMGKSGPTEPLPVQAQQLAADHRMLDTPLTQAGMVMGTPTYMSPEQFRNDELDERSDQFSFCAALYLGLYRQRPFEPGKMESFASSSMPLAENSKGGQHTQPMTPKRSRTGKANSGPSALIQEPPRDAKVPAWVKQAVMRGLSLEPSARFPSMQELLRALSQEERRVRRQRWGMAAAAAGVVSLAVGGGVYRHSQLCAGAGDPVDEVWNAASRQKLEAAFGATGKPFAQELASRVGAVLEGYATDWKHQSTQACEATRVQGVQPEELLARRVVCLERRRKDLRATVDLLGQADAAMVTKALDVAYALPTLQECADVETLTEQQGLPSDPSKRAEIEKLEGRLTLVRAMVDAGRYKPALEAAKQLEEPVLATGYLPLTAELRFHMGWLEEQVGESPEAARLLSQAAYDAESSRADRLKIAILNKLLFVEDGQKHFGQAEGWGGMAEASIRRIGGSPVLEADVRGNQANMAISQGQLPQARTLLEQARALQDQALPAGHPKRARTTFLLSRVLMDLGEKDRAIELMEEALKQTEASVGPMHPDMAQRHGLLGVALRELKQPERALEHAREAAAIRKATFGVSKEYGISLDEIGMCLLDLKRYDEALQTYQEALAVKKQVLPADHQELQFSYDGVGQALLALGRPQEAVEPLRQALTFTTVSPDVLAESGFALAKALWLSGHQEEARQEAAQARERFTQAELPARSADVDTWLASLPKERTPSARATASATHR
ncbi:protein kinase domain-containing protein [Hyalangium versicolor]|uniref:serine/threonine-protein kinase n=1 Tax=Hyalangium versicolor TaxID=2861190 RepID=UPI001CCE28A8|nr:serine/threonine-protein kinase [Hyalangium versicolor]